MKNVFRAGIKALSLKRCPDDEKIDFKSIFKIKGYSVPILICVVLLSVFGCVMVYSASYYSAGLNGNQYHYLIKQIVAKATIV